METVSFDEALFELKQGSKIKRIGWIQWLVITNNSIVLDDTIVVWQPTVRDILATDWLVKPYQ